MKKWLILLPVVFAITIAGCATSKQPQAPTGQGHGLGGMGQGGKRDREHMETEASMFKRCGMKSKA